MNSLEASLIAVAFGVALTAILAYCVRISARQAEQATEIATLKVQVSPLWARVQAQISNDLHHPHPRYFEMDKLLEKLEALTINESERIRLKVLLDERARDQHDDISEEQRKKASLMAQVMDLVVEEAKDAKR